MKAKLVVPSQFSNGLVGNREAIIATGVDVHIPVGDQVLDYTSENEVVIEVSERVFSSIQYKLLSLETEKLRDTM